MHRRWALVWILGQVGCGPLVLPEGDVGSSTGDEASSGPGTTAPGTTLPPPSETTAPPMTTVGPEPGDGTTTGDDPGSTSTPFIVEGDVPPGDECDLWLQDCPRGEKCVPWSNDGGSGWNALRCSPIAEDPAAVGEPCVVEGSPVSGLDSCGVGAMCFYVDPVTLEGQCVALCVGSADFPMCEPANTSCVMNSEGTIALCLPGCDPLLQDCGDGQTCIPIVDDFLCVLDESGDAGAPGDGCAYINACDPGVTCQDPELVPGCDPVAGGCCTSFCSVSEGPLPCLPGQECLPWYEPGFAPPGTEDYGVCGVPL
jgi:hypothetical protein